MGINIRQKGFDAEREVASELNTIIHMVLLELGQPLPAKPIVQRNQLQSAVGGCDLTGTFGLAVEVKRQETLSLNTWWAQCVKSANKRDESPVLLFRQSKQKWRCMLFVDTPLPSMTNAAIRMRAEISFEDFKVYFRTLVERHLSVAPLLGNDHPHLFE